MNVPRLTSGSTTSPREIERAMIQPDDEVLISWYPLDRMGSPEDDVAEAIYYLCSADAGYVTSSELSVTGGQHLY